MLVDKERATYGPATFRKVFSRALVTAWSHNMPNNGTVGQGYPIYDESTA